MTSNLYGEREVVPEASRGTRWNVRCGSCGKLLAEVVTAPWRIKCRHCKAVNESEELTVQGNC